MDQRIPTKAIYESNHEKYGVVVTSSKGEQVKNEYTTILNQNSQ